MAGESVLGAVRQSLLRRWLEVVLPLYTLAFLAVMWEPHYLPSALGRNTNESVLPWVGWAVVGAMTGILVLWALIITFFLLYAPFYLLGRVSMLAGRGPWVDKRELRFYSYCFLLLCGLAILSYADPWKGLWAFVLLSGCGPLFWRYVV